MRIKNLGTLIVLTIFLIVMVILVGISIANYTDQKTVRAFIAGLSAGLGIMSLVCTIFIISED